MTKEPYKIEGRGKTPKEADKALGRARSELVGKLKKGKVSIDLDVARTRVFGSYELLKGIDPTTVDATRFSIEATGWQDLQEKETRMRDGGKYEGTLVVEEYFALTDEQRNALTETRRPPAGYDERRRPILRLGLDLYQ